MPMMNEGLTPEATDLSRNQRARGAMRWLSGLNTVRGYDRSWLRHDVQAGLVTTAMLVPVGIKYAQAFGLPGISGLYATIVPLLRGV